MRPVEQPRRNLVLEMKIQWKVPRGPDRCMLAPKTSERQARSVELGKQTEKMRSPLETAASGGEHLQSGKCTPNHLVVTPERGEEP